MRSDESTPDDSPPILPYRSAEPRPAAEVFRTVADMPPAEAAMARAKLDAEGIASYIAGEDVSGIHPLAFSSVKLQVMEADFDRAREVLDRLPADDEEGDYADEPWRCPKCHRKEIDILPLTAGYRRLRNVGIALFILPVIAFVALGFAAQSHGIKTAKEWMTEAVPAWLLAVLIIAAMVMFSNRPNRCRACGHEWKN